MNLAEKGRWSMRSLLKILYGLIGSVIFLISCFVLLSFIYMNGKDLGFYSFSVLVFSVSFLIIGAWLVYKSNSL